MTRKLTAAPIPAPTAPTRMGHGQNGLSLPIAGGLFSEKEFFEVFNEDLQHLLKQGVDKDDVPIMLDQLRYFVEE